MSEQINATVLTREQLEKALAAAKENLTAAAGQLDNVKGSIGYHEGQIALLNQLLAIQPTSLTINQAEEAPTGEAK